MVDVVKYEARLRYRARRLGYAVMQTRGSEYKRREASERRRLRTARPRRRGPAYRHVGRYREVFTGWRPGAETAATLSGGRILNPN